METTVKKEPDLHVHVTNMPELQTGPLRSSKRSTYSTVKLDGVSKTFQLLIGASVHRVGLVVSFLGQSTDVAYLCGSQADAQNLAGAEFMGLQVTPSIIGTDAVWVAVPAGTSMRFGVVATFEDAYPR